MTLTKRLTRVSELLVALSGSPVPTHLFQTLADWAGEVVPNDALALCLADPDGHGYLVHSLSGAAPPLPDRPFGDDEGLAGEVIRTGRSLVVDDLAAAPAAGDLEAAWARAGVRAALVMPLRRGFTRLGALYFAARPPTAYGEEDVQIAALIAAGLSGALECSRAYQGLADERSTLAAVLASTQDAVLMVNADGIVLLANPAVGPMLNIDPDALSGRPLLEVVTHAPLRRVFEESSPGVAEIQLPDGRIAQASVVPVTTPYGEAVGLAAILRDITVLKDLERMKNDFVNAVSHDLKSPISAVVGTAELMLRAGPGDAKHTERCLRIRNTASLMNDLVVDLLDLGRIQAGLEALSEHVDLVALAREAMTALAAQAEAREIELAADLVAHAPVRAARGRLKQALMNLIGNAVKYTPKGGRVTVSVSLPPAGDGRPLAGEVVVTVADSGIGIPARDLPFVFDKFYRVKSEETDGTPGTGLGLAITKSIIEAHGGRIWVQSVSRQGSTFGFAVPLIAS